MDVRTLFITNRDDASTDYLISKFNARSSSYLRINSEDIALFNFEIDPAGRMSCTTPEGEYSLSNVHSVVFKRIPSKYNNPPGDENAPYLNNERKHFFEGLYLSLQQAKWINPMFATHTAERKLYQLQVASSIGLKIPRSLITNNRDRAISFLSSNDRSIIKPISNGLQILKDQIYSIYTTEVSANSFSQLSLAQTFSTPVFLQQLIPNRYDIRVTIIGQSIFAVRIGKKSDEVDWRRPEIEKHYQQFQLPKALEDKLLAIMAHFKMVYSAIDLIETPDGDFVFLEINPVGEWAWLELELGINISKKLIDELL